MEDADRAGRRLRRGRPELLEELKAAEKPVAARLDAEREQLRSEVNNFE